MGPVDDPLRRSLENIPRDDAQSRSSEDASEEPVAWQNIKDPIGGDWSWLYEASDVQDIETARRPSHKPTAKRRIVKAIPSTAARKLAHAVPPPIQAAPRDERSRAQQDSRSKRRVSTTWMRTAAVVSLILVGFIFGHFVRLEPSGRDGVLVPRSIQLASRVEPVENPLRAPDTVRTILEVRSTTAGFVSVLLVGPTRTESLPRPGGDEYPVSPNQPANIPLQVTEPLTAHVFVTQTGGAYEIIRKYVIRENPHMAGITKLIEDELRRKGHEWVLTRSIVINPNER